VSDYESKHFATAVGEFLAWFEALFDHDWEHTKAMMQSPDCIDPDRGTFLNPGCGETHSNWANREGFVNAYRRLRMLLMQQGIDPDELESLLPPQGEPEDN